MTSPASPLGKKCPDCGTDNAASAEYCSKCAHPLIAATGETPDANLRGDIFGQEGAWLDKSNKEQPAQKKEAPKPLDQQSAQEGEVELAFDPLQRRMELDAAAAEERRKWDEAHKIEKPRYEFTARAVIVGIVVALFVGASYPYVVLKLGYGPNISVVSAFFGYMILAIVGLVMTKLTKKDHRSGRVEYNIVQTAGSAAGQTAFMCVLLAAFDLLASNPRLDFHVQPSPLQVFLWLSVAGLLGVLLAVPLRRYYIDQEKLTFADGTAAGETLLVLDEGAAGAKKQLRWLLFGGIFSFIFAWFRDGEPKFIPGVYTPGAAGGKWEQLNVGTEISPLSFGSGLLVGLRITASMALGMVIAWIYLPDPLFAAHITSEETFKETLRWVMWPATGLMVSGGLTALALNWKSIAATVRDLKKADTRGSDFPMRWVIIGSLALSVALIIVQKYSLGIAMWESAVAIVISVPLMLVGIRVLGETNWAPISSMANMVQAIFAAISPGSIASNMVASGMSGTVAGSGEQLMQDYRAGKIVGSTNRHLTYMQLIATPVGAAAVALAYPLLKHQYGIGPDRYGISAEAAKHSTGKGLSAPISVKWAGFAELLSGGLSNLPKYAGWALLLGVVLGIVITLFEKKYKDYLPSPTGIALGMLIPATSVIPMLIGGIVQVLWHRANKAHEEEVSTPLASGLIVGEAMVALLLPVLATLALLGPLHDWLLPFTNFVNEKLHFTLFIKGE